MSAGVDPSLSGMTLWLPFLALLAAAVVWDLHLRRIPNAIPLALACLGLVTNLWYQPVGPALLLSAGGLLAGFAFWLAPYLLRIAGGADLKLAAAVGVWLGPLGVVRASVFAALAGGVLALAWLVRSLGFAGSWVFLTSAVNLRGDSSGKRPGVTTVPYALALTIGAVCELLVGDFIGGAL
ncbi:MAG: prepilin peptidase [Gemmatimonadota bacterium]|nr:MAG: prepilin peptidase [Gemmatimonadota bacterium]